MKKGLLSDWYNFMLNCELDNNIELLIGEGFDESDIEKYKVFLNEFFKFEGEDREIVLEDLKKGEGILYKKMCDYNENELVIKFGLNMVWWEYSIEDYFRDTFDKDNFEKDEFSLFDLKDIDKMMYGEYYNEED